MKILVTVSETSDVDDDFEIAGTSIDERYLTKELNEWDEYAIEEAVQMSEENDDVEVVTVTIGSDSAEETIRQALAKGADRAIRLWDDALEDASVLDPKTKARLVAEIVEDEDPDLVLTGVQSGDLSFGATGIQLANELGFQWAAVVNQLEIEEENGVASVHRELEGGVEELTEVELPAVLTIQTGINEPRYASLRGIRQAQSKPLDAKSLADLGVDEDDLSLSMELTSLYEPETEGEAEIFEGSADETAGQLAELLAEKGVEA
jgi:electron transfer flavoprotein beta subunit